MFSKLYRVLDDLAMMKKKFDEAWLVTCNYPDVSITTCSSGWAVIEGDPSETDAIAMEARLDAIFMNS